MNVELKIPQPGESIKEVVLSKWFVENGAVVRKDDEIGEVESDKATLPLIAPVNGEITIIVTAGTTIDVGSVACTINTLVQPTAQAPQKTKETKNISVPIEEKSITSNPKSTEQVLTQSNVKITPIAKKMIEENSLTVTDIINGLKRIGKEEVELVLNGLPSTNSIAIQSKLKERNSKREAMSQLRKKLSKRLVTVKNETAMLTTFNEADMSGINELRNKYQKQFTDTHGIKLGFMSFFVKAAAIALQQYPKVNSYIDGEDIVEPNFSDIGIAVQTPKGLMVPILRNAESMSLADIEKNIAALAEKARAARISIDDMTGGTFTITNGGVFGSLLSTPIINPPQSAILGMHNIVDRPVAINGKVEIRPMMYLALSYDHRIIDGKDSVSFLVKIKELLENPYKMLFNGAKPENLLLQL